MTRGSAGWVRVAVAAGAWMMASACSDPTPQFAHLDKKMPVPAAMPIPVDEATVEDGSETATAPADAATACGPTTGRRADGECQTLATYDAGYVQRVQIPAGEFVTGDIPRLYSVIVGDAPPYVRWSANPIRLAAVDGFFIDLFEVTKKAYDGCVSEGRCSPAQCATEDLAEVPERFAKMADKFPQACVSHAQAAAFCNAKGGRLPTELEWEYAARGVDGRTFPWGNDINDELPQGRIPTNLTHVDRGYFGIFGMGISVTEWVADVYDEDAGLRPFLAADFRSPSGPSAIARREHERAFGLPRSDEKGGTRSRHVVKYGRIADRRYGVDVPDGYTSPASAPLKLDPTAAIGPSSNLGFRCVSDLREGDEPLRVPAVPPAVTETKKVESLEVFAGVADAVSLAEARAFCRQLRVPSNGEVRSDFRLPSRAELAVGEVLPTVFAGPGPFWTSDGAMRQQQAYDPSAPWEPLELSEDTPLAARCIRSESPSL